ncbi:DUF3488 and DUF4129 domain-containing transglutaminase family protein [Chloroflexota bacterium]
MQSLKYMAVSRILAFLALSTTIIAISWLIRDPWLSAIGIPGLAIGHIYSWYQKKVSITRSVILLLFMVLTVFLGKDILLSGLSDRLLLSRYIIYGLVIGSFDLMVKRNVEASLILGVMLMVLISELALSMWFIIFVVVFTILALASVLISRLGAETENTVMVGELSLNIAGRTWLGFITGAMLIAAVLFLIMPRVASSQMAQASWLPSRLDLTSGSPGSLPSRPSAPASSGILPSSQDWGTAGEGEYISLGYSGSAADEVVMNVRSRISSYWRGMTLDEYDGRGWLATSPQLELRDEGRGEYVMADSRLGASDERTYWQIYYLLTDQPSAIFTGYYPGRIFLSGQPQGYLEAGVMYRALSSVPYLSPNLLRGDRTIPAEFFLALPPVSERTAVLAKSIVENAGTDYDKAARIERFLMTNYPYRLDVEPLPPGWDAVDYFLFEEQAGYCSHFATTMAVMARHVGLPARVAAGYLPGYIDPLTGAHIVRAGDAHAWVEIYFERYGWVAFDPTPRADATKGFAAERNLVYFGLEDFTGGSLAGIMSPLAASFTLGKVSLPGWFWIVLIVIAVAVMFTAMVFSNRRSRKDSRRPVKYSVLDGETRRMALDLYRRMVSILVKKGFPARQPYQSPYEYAAVVCPQILEGRETVEQLTRIASSAAYDPDNFVLPDVAGIKKSLSALRQALLNSQE